VTWRAFAPDSMPKSTDLIVDSISGPALTVGAVLHKFAALYGYPEGATWRHATPEEREQHEADEAYLAEHGRYPR